jgi:pantoate--beta-alanine ligase
MLVFNTINEIRAYLLAKRQENKSVGFVPTMGALHKGHLSLIATAKNQNDITVCSIFVNPTQFNNADDLAKYPRTLQTDCDLLETTDCDVVFAPLALEMYPEPTTLKFDFGTLETVMEGKFRAGHFNGVGVVVSKLFHIVQPDKAYFGQKDLQQTAVIRQMIIDLGFPIEFVVCPTLREADGLAMSSRNVNLLPEHRPKATEIFKILTAAKLMLLSEKSAVEVQEYVTQQFDQLSEFKLEYFEIVNAKTLINSTQKQSDGQTALCIAAFLGKVRLIDNFVF